jgi:hypothetical protein
LLLPRCRLFVLAAIMAPRERTPHVTTVTGDLASQNLSGAACIVCVDRWAGGSSKNLSRHEILLCPCELQGTTSRKRACVVCTSRREKCRRVSSYSCPACSNVLR